MTLLKEFRRIFAYRWQIWLDTEKDLISDSRETWGQLLWVIAIPLVPLGLYMFLAWLRVFPPHGEIRAVPFILVGATLWFLFSGLFLGPISAISRKAKVAAQSNYPLSGVLASTALLAWVEFAIRLVLVAIVLAVVQPPSLQGAIGFLGVVLPLSLFFWGAGTIIAIFSVAWKDLGKLVAIVVQYLFFLSNVLFTLPEDVIPRWISWINPFAFAIDTSRWFLMFGEFLSIKLWIAWSVCGLLVALKALHFTATSEQRLAPHL